MTDPLALTLTLRLEPNTALTACLREILRDLVEETVDEALTIVGERAERPVEMEAA